MESKEFSRLLEQRARDFAVRIVRLSTILPDTPEGREIRKQITKSGTSIGANYREANRARSRADFKSKIKICQGEASETQYWLELIIESGWLSRQQIEPEINEAKALLAIFGSVAKN